MTLALRCSLCKNIDTKQEHGIYFPYVESVVRNCDNRKRQSVRGLRPAYFAYKRKMQNMLAFYYYI